MSMQQLINHNLVSNTNYSQYCSDVCVLSLEKLKFSLVQK